MGKIDSSVKLNWYTLLLSAAIVLYLVLRLSWPQTVEFGYDQPKLANQVKDFIAHGTFLASHNFVTPNPWGSYSWGPANIFFYLPFLAVTSDPLTASLLVASFGAVSIIFVSYFAKHAFNERVAIVAAFLLAVHPWWVVFSRMIYQPTPIIPFILLSSCLLLTVVKRKESFFVAPLVVSWGILLQLYFHTFPFVLMSVFAVLFKIRMVSIKYLLVGISLCAVLFIPYLEAIYVNPDFIRGFATFSENYSVKSSLFSEAVAMAGSFPTIVSGGGFEWQLGDATEDFKAGNVYYSPAMLILTLLVLAMFIYHIVFLIKYRQNTFFRWLLVAWAVGPTWFLVLTRAPELVPRYFLTAVPFVCILIAIFVVDISKKLGPVVVILPMFLVGYYLIFVNNYFRFIANYSYPNGFISYTSDPPYVFLKNALDWIFVDSAKKGLSKIVISADPEKPYEPALTDSAAYMLKHYYQYNTNGSNSPEGYYVLTFSDYLHGHSIESYKLFGPYMVFQNAQLPKDN